MTLMDFEKEHNFFNVNGELSKDSLQTFFMFKNIEQYFMDNYEEMDRFIDYLILSCTQAEFVWKPLMEAIDKGGDKLKYFKAKALFGMSLAYIEQDKKYDASKTLHSCKEICEQDLEKLQIYYVRAGIC